MILQESSFTAWISTVETLGKVKETSLTLERLKTYTFKPFDAIVVRKKAGFEFQEYVTIGGEVAYPGRYAIREGEKVGD